METAEQITSLVRDQLALIEDKKIAKRIGELLVSPYPSERGWDYGRPDEKFVCWMVLEHRESNTGIAFCSQGFGPKNPWGLLFIEGPYMSMGMDSGWYSTLEWTFRESMAYEDSTSTG
jgi:hypothetical protein